MSCAFLGGVPRNPIQFQMVGGPMTRKLLSSQAAMRRVITLGVIVAAWLAIGGSAAAGPRRARLSRDLSERLTKADAGVTNVIVNGSSDKVQTLAKRYG